MVTSNLTFDPGLRRRFKLQGPQAALRVLTQNIADKGGWTATTAGGFARSRRAA